MGHREERIPGVNLVTVGTQFFDELIAEVRREPAERLGELLDTYRNYLHLLAKTQIDDKLRARVSRVRLWQPQGKTEEARQMLEEIYN